MHSVGERVKSEFEMFQRMGEKWGIDLRVAMPGIVQSFDVLTQTAVIQPALNERIVDGSGNISMVKLPLLLDVPIFMPRSGGFVLTMPIIAGDECLVIFGDMCIDSWWSLGEIQNQAEIRRHDLSDAIAILGIWSQPRKVADYSLTSAQLRAEGGTSIIDVKENEIDITSTTVKVNGINFSSHTHVAPDGGGTTSGPS